MQRYRKSHPIARLFPNNCTFVIHYSHYHGRPHDPRAAPPLHEPHPQPQHTARDARTPLSLCPRLPLPCQRAPPARHARHRPRPSPHLHLHQRLFLARPRRMFRFQTAAHQHRLLATENRPQPPARPRTPAAAPPHGLECHTHLGLPTQNESQTRRNPTRTPRHPQPHHPRWLRPPRTTRTATPRRRRRRTLWNKVKRQSSRKSRIMYL